MYDVYCMNMNQIRTSDLQHDRQETLSYPPVSYVVYTSQLGENNVNDNRDNRDNAGLRDTFVLRFLGSLNISKYLIFSSWSLTA